MRTIEELEESARQDEVATPFAVLRLDGKNFTGLTRGMARFDPHFTHSMHVAVKSTADFIGSRYLLTGSDEASFLISREDSKDGSLQFGGKLFKLLSLSASNMSVAFSDEFGVPALFDARIIQCETKEEVSTVFNSRAKSLFRNAVSSAAWEKFGHKFCLGLSTGEKISALGGINNITAPAEELFGTHFSKERKLLPITEENRLAIPEQHRPAPGTLVARSVWDQYCILRHR